MTEERYKELIILHSNDLHGNFLSENTDQKLLGGISMLSGYVSQVRAENDHALYCIAGDMLQGSLIDSEYKGISTIEIMNMLSPDVASIGNHETDYGLAHLLFLERCANFPIVNANLFIKNPYTRLFNSHKIVEVNGMQVLFIGIITQEVMNNIRLDKLLGGLVDVEEAANEVGQICNAYSGSLDIDMTVLLTHIGFEDDKRLAALLDPSWGVDMIIGGHSHTVLEKPEVINGILIAQAGVGTAQIGRFDLVIDTEKNRIKEYKWELVPIDSLHCPRDEQMEDIISRYKERIDQKYERILCRFMGTLTHPSRYRETELGDLMCDALQEVLDIDLMILGSGSIRKPKAGPIFTYGNLLEVMPYDDRVLALKVTGAQLRRMLRHVFRDENVIGEEGEFYQFSKGIRIVYDVNKKIIETLEFNGEPLGDDDVITIGLQEYHIKNFDKFFNMPLKDLADGKGVPVTASILAVLEEYFDDAELPDAEVEGRLVVH
ncbi:MAG: bifunctional metallophosphatase/5'-nucleotidase [Methanomassiliicoccaceae archaeon]|jgi:5'-nucleotidase|nr:bifunctional metallophosphatase/5'-nucleotidase [Methanomassiliicoccaceae archaeon]